MVGIADSSGRKYCGGINLEFGSGWGHAREEMVRVSNVHACGMQKARCVNGGGKRPSGSRRG